MCSPEMLWYLRFHLNGLHCKVSSVESLHTLTIWWLCLWGMDHYCSNSVTPTCLLSRVFWTLSLKVSYFVSLCFDCLKTQGSEKIIVSQVVCLFKFPLIFVFLFLYPYKKVFFPMHVLRGRIWKSVYDTHINFNPLKIKVGKWFAKRLLLGSFAGIFCTLTVYFV